MFDDGHERKREFRINVRGGFRSRRERCNADSNRSSSSSLFARIDELKRFRACLMSAAARAEKLDVRSHGEKMRETHNIDACPRASRPPPSQREARARRVVSRARRSHRSLPLETRPGPRVVRGLPKRSVSKRASTCRDARDERLLRAARARRPVRRERGQAEAPDRRQDLQGAPRGSRRRARARDAPSRPPAPANEGSREDGRAGSSTTTTV